MAYDFPYRFQSNRNCKREANKRKKNVINTENNGW